MVWLRCRKPSIVSNRSMSTNINMGFSRTSKSDKAPKGLNEDIVRFISAKKNEPEWLTEWRLEAYRRWLTMREPTWARVDYPPIDYQDLYYYSAPKTASGPEVARRSRSGIAEGL